jgi:AraC-like DNA-binding protein
MIENADYLVRLLAIGAGLMLIAQLVAGDVRGAIKLPLVAMLVGVVAYLINAAPLALAGHPLKPLVDLFSISTPFWIWLFARRLFESEPEQRFAYAAAAVLALGWVLGHFVPVAGRAGFYIIHLAALALIADLARVAWSERKDDLVEQRRIVRLWLPLLVAAQAAAVLLFEVLAGTSQLFPAVNLLNSLLILVITLFAGLALLRTDPELLFASEPAEAEPVEEPQPARLSPGEAALHERLNAAMAEGAYRTPGLTIAGLADMLETPEHRLRALINRRLGHRNFSAFLNRHRIAEARARLADRACVDLPVLTIAMDLGYNSLATFNRAFRAETGTSPSEYRREAMAEGFPAGATTIETDQN